jgi:S-DNA-T family DNA segregation ATPase FtsK/SpoIIIE
MQPTIATGAGALSLQKKKSPRLEAEFRKNFRVSSSDERPTKPLSRDERLPPLNILEDERSNRPNERHINLTAGLIEKSLAEFGLPAKVVGFQVGPTVTQFAVEPGFMEKPGAEGEAARQKVRVAQISALSRDLALALAVPRLRIEAPVPGRPYVGIEVPNARSTLVRLRPLLEAETFQMLNSPLAIALGRDVSGRAVVADMVKMPHLLIAGTTGSGKSVCITALTTCLVMNNTPGDLRLVMIDPKMVELVRFNGLPHLLGKVETDIRRILGVLHWIVVEMDRRYKLLEQTHSRHLDSYNRKMSHRKDGEVLPRIVVLVDELADLMMTAPDQTEHALVRLAQMARATGIHLVVATQRPSVDVVTGLIKANFPARLSFAVASGVDSRVILDTQGAESLLGRGDMLFMPPNVAAPIRAQGAVVTDQEIERLIAFWRGVLPQAQVADAIASRSPWEDLLAEDESRGDHDALLDQAIVIVRQTQRANASLLQRRLKIGYPRAARLIDEMESMGIVGPSQGGGRDRDVLIEPEE